MYYLEVISLDKCPYSLAAEKLLKSKEIGEKNILSKIKSNVPIKKLKNFFCTLEEQGLVQRGSIKKIEDKILIILGIFNIYDVFYIISKDLKRISRLLLIL